MNKDYDREKKLAKLKEIIRRKKAKRMPKPSKEQIENDCKKEDERESYDLLHVITKLNKDRWVENRSIAECLDDELYYGLRKDYPAIMNSIFEHQWSKEDFMRLIKMLDLREDVWKGDSTFYKASANVSEDVSRKFAPQLLKRPKIVRKIKK